MTTKIKAILGLNNLTPEGKVTKAQGFVDSMQVSPHFPAGQMPLSYPVLQTVIDDLHNAIIAANAGTTTSTSDMHEKERLLILTFNLVKAHVELTANNTADPATVITSAGMQIAGVGGSVAVSELTLDAMGNGSVIIKVPRNNNEKAYVYEMSTDNTTFTKITSTSLAKISITGQVPGSTVYVRYYSIGKEGESAMSQPKSIMVI